MAFYKIQVETEFWSCECCGEGYHWEVGIYDQTNHQLWATSRNDQFGGTLNETHEETTCYSWEDLVLGIQKGLEAVGHTVYIEKHLSDD